MKRSVDQLAIFNQKPIFDRDLHIGCPNIGNREKLIARINDALDRRFLTNDGPFALELEKRIADMIGVKHCIVMCNGTMALEIIIRAAELTGEVIVPSFTFIATAHALQRQGIKPVFCDIDPDSHNINPDRIEALITPQTTGIIGVHLWGRACPVAALSAISEKHNLKLLFDAAHAFGCSHNDSRLGNHMIGNYGNAEIFSFHATKVFNTFEGGAVVTNDDQLAEKVRLMKNFGFSDYDTVVELGTNAKMNEISAAMGLTGLESFKAFVADNYRNYQCYKRALADIPGVKLLAYNETEKCNYQYIVIEWDKELAGVNRDQLVDILHAENILARRYFYPGCHRMEPYRSCYPNAGLLLPETERLAKRVLTLPTGTNVKPSDIKIICQIIRLVVMQRTALMNKLTNNDSV